MLKIGLDKWLHATACFIVAMLVGLVLVALGAENWKAGVAGMLAGLVVGAFKEAYDATCVNGTGWNWADMAADAVGAVLGFFGVLASV